MEKKFVRVDIVDNDNGYDGERIMDTYILAIPTEEHIYYKEKLVELQNMLNNRFDEENELCDDYGAIHEYITENFEVLQMADFIEIEW